MKGYVGFEIRPRGRRTAGQVRYGSFAKGGEEAKAVLKTAKAEMLQSRINLDTVWREGWLAAAW